MAKKGKGKNCSNAAKVLAECRWSKAGAKSKAKAVNLKAKPKSASKKPKPAVRQSRRLAGKEPVRRPEPPRKPRKKADNSRAPTKSSFKAERFITGDENYGAPIYGRGVSVLDGALRQFRQAGYDRGL